MRKIILLLAIALVVPPAIGNATNHKPTLAQIEAAKKAEAAKKRVKCTVSISPGWPEWLREFSLGTTDRLAKRAAMNR